MAASTNKRAWVRGPHRSGQNPNLAKRYFCDGYPLETCLESLRRPLWKMSFRETREVLLGEMPFQEPWVTAQFAYKARFDLENIDETECLAEFKDQKEDIPVLANAFQRPIHICCPQRTIFDRIEGLYMLLRRLSYRCRYSVMIRRFGRPVPELCMINFVFLHNSWHIFNLAINKDCHICHYFSQLTDFVGGGIINDIAATQRLVLKQSFFQQFWDLYLTCPC